MKRLSVVGRSAAAMGIALTMLVAAGTGAGAAAKIQLQNYTASSAAQTLHIGVQLPSAVSSILRGSDLAALSNIDQTISFASALGQWDKSAKAIKGESVAQVFQGSLNGLIANVLGVESKKLDPTTSKVNKANDAGDSAHPNTSTIRSISLPDEAAPIVRVGIGTTRSTAKSAAETASTHSESTLASVDVSLKALQNTAAESLIDPLMDTLNGSGTSPGLIDKINAELKALNLPVAVSVAKVPNLLETSILHVGIMTSTADTGVTKLAKALSNGATEYRTATATNRLADVSVLGGLVSLKAIELSATARLDNKAGNPSATPVTRILGLRVGGNVVDLTAGTLSVLGQTIKMPLELQALMNNLVVNVAGVHIEALRNTKEIDPKTGHAFAQANSLKISVAPTITDPTTHATSTLFAINLQGPMARAGVDAGSTAVLGRRITRTGLNDTAFLVVGPMLLGAAILVRRFAFNG